MVQSWYIIYIYIYPMSIHIIYMGYKPTTINIHIQYKCYKSPYV